MAVQESDACSPIRSVLSWTNLLPFPLLERKTRFTTSAELSSRLWGEALALYEQSLRTDQELGDVRGVAVTQHDMTNVLVQQGKVGEALALYEQSLRTKKEIGDVRGVAVTQANMSQLLLRQGELRRALRMAWEAYTSLSQ